MTRQDVALLDRMTRLSIAALQLQTDLVNLRWAFAQHIKQGKPKRRRRDRVGHRVGK